MRLFCAIALLLLMSLPLAAQDSATRDRVIAAFSQWMADHDIAKGALELQFKGAHFASHSVGIGASDTLEMASLGKAITGVCVAELVREGRMAYSDRYSDLVGQGPDVTIAQLLTHASGLTTDSTQTLMPDWLDDPQDQAETVLDQVIARGDPQGQVGSFAYNNENYALLSIAIEVATLNSYEATCVSRVLEPAGVNAERSPRTGGFLAWGGWQMSLKDYAKFMSHWFGEGFAPTDHPNAHVNRGAHYGLGMFFREFRGSHNYWHFGALCFPDRLNTGTYAVSWMGEWSLVASYETCPGWDAMGALDGALSGAVFQ